MIKGMKDYGISTSKISRILGISRTTVRNYLKSKKLLQYLRIPTGSKLEPYIPLMRDMIDQHNLSAVKTYEGLKKKSFQESYSIMNHYSRPMRNDRK
ncbi:MAG: hypothetical protein ACYCUZ_03555 [Cuniculiplasma sp.]|jgi:predicted transcriptional regulator